jgi:hypothetical protein
MNEVTLNREDERLRLECEREAGKCWPGARVLVHAVGEQYRAAVYLTEDGVDPDASADPSDLYKNPRGALDEVLHAVRGERPS